MSFFEEVNIKTADSPSMDAFGRFRMSFPVTLFESMMVFDAQPLIWDDAQLSGATTAVTSSTYNTNQCSVTMSVSGGAVSRRVRQTKQYFCYQPGKSHLAIFTGIIGAPQAGIKRCFGLHCEHDGLFFELTGSTFSVVKRGYMSGTAQDTAYAQSVWNLDRLDGTSGAMNPSGHLLDTSKINIYFLDFEFLGAGRVRFGVNIDGKPIYVHEINHANSATQVYMSSANLPVRWEIENDGTGSAASVTQVGTSVMSEGGDREHGISFSIPRTSVLTTNNSASAFPLIAIRQKTTHQHTNIELTQLTVACTSSSTYLVEVVLNPTIVGTVLDWTSLTNSCMEYCTTSTSASVVSGGTVIHSSIASQDLSTTLTNLSPSKVPIGSTIAGVSDIVVISVTRLTGNAEDFFGALQWKEEY